MRFGAIILTPGRIVLALLEGISKPPGKNKHLNFLISVLTNNTITFYVFYLSLFALNTIPILRLLQFYN